MENAFAILASRFTVLRGTMEQRAKVVRGIVLTCVVLHNMLKTHQGRLNRALIPADNIAVIANGAVVHMPDENYRNHLREEKHQPDLLKDYFHHLSALAGQEDMRYEKELSYYLSVLLRTTQLFQELLLKLVLHQCPINFQQSLQ